jgi:hypothetical protein
MRRAAILAVIYLLPAIFILRPVVIDPDVWWHLETGKWIMEHGTLPATDPFSAYGEGKPWVAYSWLFELGMYALVQLCGERGIILYTLVGTWLIMLVMHRLIGTRCSDFLLVSGLLAVSVLALSKLLTPRPWLLTMLVFVLTLDIVLSLREGRQSKWFWLLPLAYAVWANVHIQFVYGLALLGLAIVAPLIDHLVRPVAGCRPVMVAGSPQWKQLVTLTMLCILATLANPHHLRLYSVVAELAAQTGMWEYTQEMQAPAFRSVADWAMLAIFAAALVHVGWRRSWSSFEGLLIVVAAVSAFRGQRDAWFLVLASLTVLVSGQLPTSRERLSVPFRGRLVPVMLAVTVGVACLSWYRGFSEANIHQNTAKLYPVAAAEFIEQQGYRGPLYNHFDWGGYLIWRLPHLKVSMDGRANVHGDDRIKRSITTWTGGSHWREDSELNAATVVIAQKDMALASLLRLDSRFHVAYQDDTAVVFIRAPSGHGQAIELASSNLFPAFSMPLRNNIRSSSAELGH